jgi:hypothetical protein
MSFANCIDEALKQKKFGPKKRDEINERFEAIYDELVNDGFSEADAGRMAAEKAVERHDVFIRERKKRQLAHIAKVAELDNRLANYKDKRKPWNAAIAYIEHDDVAPWSDYITMQDRIRGQSHAMLADLIDKFGRKGAGIRNRAESADNIVRELYSEGSSGNAEAAAMAKAWTQATDFLVRRFNNAGGSLLERKNWRLPQHQSRWLLAKAERARWVGDHMDWLDWDAVRSDIGRRIPLNRRREVLRGLYDTIKTNGHIAPPKEFAGVAATGNQLDYSRFLIFKDADSWLAMNKAYGDADVYEIMMSHLDIMSSRVAMVETFGPNPAQMKELIKNRVLHAAAQVDVRPDEKKLLTATAEDKLNEFDTLFALINRENALPEANKIGRFLAGTRNVLTAAYLGAASLAAIPGDTATMFRTAAFNRTSGAKTLGRYLSMMNPANEADRQLAIRSGLIAETATQMAYAQKRLMGIDVVGPSLATRISDVTMRLSLMAPHTQAARWAFQMEVMGTLADNAAKKFDDLPVVDMLRRYGITPDEWDTFRAIKPYEHKGAKFLRPDDLYDAGLDERQAELLADKFMTMIMSEGKFAVPDASLRGAAALKGATRAGTFRGEVLNSLAMFKNFPVTLLFTHIRRGMLQDGFSGKASYLVQFAIGMTLAGALAVQMKDMAKGRDPRDMTDIKFWGAAFITGGGGTILSDFLFSDVNRYGGGFETTIGGPIAGVITDTTNLTVGNVFELAQGKETKFLPELVRFAKGVTPGQSMWWSRLIMDRLMWDQLQREIDPKAYSKWRRHERKLKRDYGQDYWWRPGATGPQRAPDFGAAVSP